jgi:hypothetical protein
MVGLYCRYGHAAAARFLTAMCEAEMNAVTTKTFNAAEPLPPPLRSDAFRCDDGGRPGTADDGVRLVDLGSIGQGAGDSDIRRKRAM